MTDQETLSEIDLAEPVGSPVDHTYLSLVLIWSSDEPWRIGQSLRIPPSGSAVVFGRGASRPGERRVPLEEGHTDQPVIAPPLETPTISRAQLELTALGRERLRVRNLGRCKVFVTPRSTDETGDSVQESELSPGDVLHLGRQLVFLVVQRTKRAASNVNYPTRSFGEPDAFGIVGESEPLARLRAALAWIAPRPGHVLVLGPSGAGKELVARAIHALSPRGRRPLVARSAATLPDSLLDAELFGNLRGYPNPGMVERPGLIGEADGSTLFLDEIGELAQSAQAHLLRLLDGGEYHRLGEARARRADVRVVAATNRERCALKHDLVGRFAFQVEVPALDERPEDIALIARHLIRRAARRGDAAALSLFPARNPDNEPMLARETIVELTTRSFALNVRELEAELWSALSGEKRTPAASPRAASTAGAGPVLEPQQIQHCLDQHNGAIDTSARALGLKNRFVLLRLIKKHGLEVRRRPGRTVAR